MKTTAIKTVNVKEVNAKFANASEIAKTTKSQKGSRKPKVSKVEKTTIVEAVMADLSLTEQHAKLRTELFEAQAKVESAKSPNTKKKYAKLVATIVDEMEAIKFQLDKNTAPEVIDVTGNKEIKIIDEIPPVATTGSAPMTEKVRLADLPIGTFY